MSLSEFINLLRVKQWIKNIFILLPLVFSKQLTNIDLVCKSFLTFFGFCLISSSIYILNDYLDRNQDRRHPTKSNRPLAQKKFSRLTILLLVTLLLIPGIYIVTKVNILIFYFAFTYVISNLLYNLYTKKMVILDVIFIAIGFQFRIWAGSIAVDVIPSMWLQLCIFLLALFLGFTKRRHEMVLLKTEAAAHRPVLEHYSIYFLDQLIMICCTLTIVFYGLYSISSEIAIGTGNSHMIYTVAFVIYGIFRYLYLMHIKSLGGDPGEIIFSDRPFLINIILWGLVTVFIIYGSTSLR